MSRGRRGPPSLEPVKSTRIYEEIVRQVKQLIAEGQLKSGDRLPPERDLAEKFMVSRTSVREALRALQSRGLIEIRAGEGAFVRDVSVETLIEPLALVILPHREAVGELFEARRLLEPAIAALAARRATREEIQEMERILEDQAKEVAAGRTGHAPGRRVPRGHRQQRPQPRHHPHRATPSWICSPRAGRSRCTRPAGPTRSHEDHRRILEAVRRRDEVAAHRSMLDHLIAVETLVTGAHADDRSATPVAAPRRKPRP